MLDCGFTHYDFPLEHNCRIDQGIAALAFNAIRITVYMEQLAHCELRFQLVLLLVFHSFICAP
jgi:hypothetical protein